MVKALSMQAVQLTVLTCGTAAADFSDSQARTTVVVGLQLPSDPLLGILHDSRQCKFGSTLKTWPLGQGQTAIPGREWIRKVSSGVTYQAPLQLPGMQRPDRATEWCRSLASALHLQVVSALLTCIARDPRRPRLHPYLISPRQ